ncbi:hypothetical protein HELRODRAFT_173165 [Helobdella robusta]|uniref:Reverse transcriptase domain-containing protein n=1 Tax=Helobdella robusta TaxID=6412 RepID=T1F6H6_HELRO|nr:hypothetical protein HELRODRAFT_173165 [Helobdella robusta]ESO04088.1 hypothetical protein HELRODRAFT_173165 [Helobdella robusta]
MTTPQPVIIFTGIIDDVSPDEIKYIIKSSCNKTSPLDPFPHQVLTNCINTLSTVISIFTNLSFRSQFPDSFKTTQVALTKLQPYIFQHPNYNPLQSAYRTCHSSETALLHILDHVFNSCNSKQATIFTWLDLQIIHNSLSHWTIKIIHRT